MKERVWLGGCPDYDPARLFARVDQAFEALHVYDQLKPGMTVVLKRQWSWPPNRKRRLLPTRP